MSFFQTDDLRIEKIRPLIPPAILIEELPLTGFRFTAAPSPVQGFGTWPVRAYAFVDEG